MCLETQTWLKNLDRSNRAKAGPWIQAEPLSPYWYTRMQDVIGNTICNCYPGVQWMPVAMDFMQGGSKTGKKEANGSWLLICVVLLALQHPAGLCNQVGCHSPIFPRQDKWQAMENRLSCSYADILMYTMVPFLYTQGCLTRLSGWQIMFEVQRGPVWHLLIFPSPQSHSAPPDEGQSVWCVRWILRLDKIRVAWEIGYTGLEPITCLVMYTLLDQPE